MFTTETLDAIAERFVAAFQKTGIKPKQGFTFRRNDRDGVLCGCALVAYSFDKKGNDKNIYTTAAEEFGEPMTTGIYSGFDSFEQCMIDSEFSAWDEEEDTSAMQFAHGVYVGCKIRELTKAT